MKTSSKTQPVPLGATTLGSTGQASKPAVALPVRVAKGKRPTSSKWAWHRDALLAMRERILGSQDGLRASSSQPMEQHGSDMADSATEEFDHELALSLVSSQQDILYEIDEAIARLEKGTYGICEATGKVISQARLRAIPWTRFTVEAETAFEKSGGAARPHLGVLGSVHAQVTGDLEGSETVEAMEEETEQEVNETVPKGNRPPGLR